ncbi:folate-binding protein [Alphaproteobacteria bacterium]|nr:folate-binding protein [Alphaproteobacteria bacterium]
MRKSALIKLEDRALISLQGSDARPFLQGLVSNDVTKVSWQRPIYSALLTPQGKYLFDFFILQPREDNPDLLWLETGSSEASALLKRLKIFKLRSQIDIHLVEPTCHHFVLLDFPENLEIEEPRAQLFNDPRHPNLGKRLILDSGQNLPTKISEFETRDPDLYEVRRIQLAVPKQGLDLIPEKTTLLEAGFEELNGLDWDKGCYMGQEVTARTKYRGLVKRRLMPLRCEGSAVKPETDLYQGQKKVGTVTSVANDWVLASLTVKSAIAVFQDGEGIQADNSDIRLVLHPAVWQQFHLESSQND